jgi:hypothetical protein
MSTRIENTRESGSRVSVTVSLVDNLADPIVVVGPDNSGNGRAPEG